MAEENNLLRLDAGQAAFRDHFLAWQCRIRQRCVRQNDGRPMAGMRPSLTVGDDAEALGQITVVLVPRDTAESTAQFRHMMRRTHDPQERFKAVIRYLSATYYRRPKAFSDELTALFGPGSKTCERLAESRVCRLDFEQYRQRYTLVCAVRSLSDSHPAYQATYWHNSLFNPEMPGGVHILGFKPDWAHAVADPPVN